mgnify:CR=1 FL=1
MAVDLSSRSEQKELRRDRNEVKFGITARLVMINSFPLILLTLVVVIVSVLSMKGSLEEEALEGLQTAAIAVASGLDGVPGDFYQDESGDVFKGDMNLSTDYEMEDDIKAQSGTDVTIFWGDTRIGTSILDSSGARLIGTQASDTVIKTVLQGGNNYTSTGVVINGTSYFVAYTPLTNDDGSIVGMAFAGKPSEKVEGQIMQTVIMVVLIALILGVACIIFGVVMALGIAKSIKASCHFIERMADGHLGIHMPKYNLDRTDELGEMSRDLLHLEDNLKHIVADIEICAEEIEEAGLKLETMSGQSSQAADEISRAVEDISKGAVSQSEEIETASMHVNNMGDEITGIVTDIHNLDEISSNMKNASDESTAIMNELSVSNERTVEAINNIDRQIRKTNESVQSIRSAVELISSIADETSLLSLNASIEAAHAGDQGRGFAVVASQIQGLADQSNTSAQNIQSIINQVLQESENTVKIMDETLTIVNTQQEKLNQTKEKFANVVTGVEHTSSETAVIRNSAQQTDNSRSVVVDVISNLSAISQENAASTQQTTASMEELNSAINLLANEAEELKHFADDLERHMKFFDTTEED